MQFDRIKMRNLILYACGACPPEQLGAVKLHKILYFCDMLFYAQAGRPMTGAEYRKRPFGPTCTPLLSMLRDMERVGDIAIREVDYFGLRKKEFIPLATPDLGHFSATELGLADEVINFVCNQNSARSISEYSHQLPWEMADFGGVITYDTALLLFPSEATPEAFDLVEVESTQIEAARSGWDAVGRTTYGDFRSRVLSEIGQA